MYEPTSIRAARWAARVPAEILAQRVGISVGWLRTIERAPGLASPELLAKLEEALKPKGGKARAGGR